MVGRHLQLLTLPGQPGQLGFILIVYLWLYAFFMHKNGMLDTPKEERKILQGRKVFLQLARKKCLIIGVIMELLQEASSNSTNRVASVNYIFRKMTFFEKIFFIWQMVQLLGAT